MGFAGAFGGGGAAVAVGHGGGTPSRPDRAGPSEPPATRNSWVTMWRHVWGCKRGSPTSSRRGGQHLGDARTPEGALLAQPQRRQVGRRVTGPDADVAGERLASRRRRRHNPHAGLAPQGQQVGLAVPVREMERHELTEARARVVEDADDPLVLPGDEVPTLAGPKKRPDVVPGGSLRCRRFGREDVSILEGVRPAGILRPPREEWPQATPVDRDRRRSDGSLELIDPPVHDSRCDCRRVGDVLVLDRLTPETLIRAAVEGDRLVRPVPATEGAGDVLPPLRQTGRQVSCSGHAVLCTCPLSRC